MSEQQNEPVSPLFPWKAPGMLWRDKADLVIAVFMGICFVIASLAPPASSLWFNLYFPYAELSETVGGGWYVEAYVLFLIVLVIISRVINALTRWLNMLAAAVSLLLLAYWGVHAANGAFTHGRRWTAQYRVAEYHGGTNAYLALEPIDARTEAPPLHVDPDLLRSSRVGDDIDVQLAEGRFGHTWVVAYDRRP